MNISVASINNTGQSFDPLPRSQSIPYVVAFIIEFLVIIGNAMVVVVFTRTKQLKKRKCYWPTISLAIADLLVGVLGGPLWLYTLALHSDLWEWKYPVFLMGSAVFQFVSYASLINLTVVALERTYATLWPLKHRVLSSRNYQVMIGFEWTLPIIFPLFDLGERHAIVSAVVFEYVWLACNWFLITTILICYISIWIKMKFYQHPQHHVTTTQDRKLTASLFLATVVSIATWLPAVVVSSSIHIHDLPSGLSTHGYYHMYHCVYLLFFANSLVNPIIYSFRMPRFRRAALRLFCRRTDERREMRNSPEVMNRQACAVVCSRPEPNMAADSMTCTTKF